MSANEEHLVSVSGGKDSTCCYLLAMEQQEKTGQPFRAIFADTQNEHEHTYEYVRTLHKRTGGPEVEWVRAEFPEKMWETRRKNIRKRWPKEGIPEHIIERAINIMHPSGNVFLDACLLRSGFPSAKSRFCTDKLKIEPIKKQVYQPLWDAGKEIVSWQGMRGEESASRAGMKERTELNFKGGTVVRYLPILRWTLADVKAFHKKHGVAPNPLYLQGSTRVGCYPCIHVTKGELRSIAERHPEHIDRIAEWEYIVGHSSKREGDATFLYAKRFSAERNAELKSVSDKYGIRKQVKWAKTTHGGRQYDLIPIDSLEVEFATGCEEWGVCERSTDGW